CGFICESDRCELCPSDDRAISGVVCVVETVADCLAVEKSGEYRGLYHILGGVLNPLQQIGPNQLTIDKLLLRIKEREVKTVLLALNPSVEGDVTCSYIREIIPQGVIVERIGLGVPIGGSLEYMDVLTIHKALENRKLL
ncbi:MAG: recombination protein RecR, partial [Oligoflexia bacterium]|nr:recombination protein RecR [Oligoflexia bacterium]